MRVLNIHGYHGSPTNAAYTALQENGCLVISPALDYDALAPDAVMNLLRGTVQKEQLDMIAGTSLGGFFAAVLCAELHLPTLLVNPCLMPFLHLPRLGYQGDIAPFLPLFGKLGTLNREQVSCIVGGKDEVIDTHDFTAHLLQNARFRVIPDGMHSGFTLPLHEYFSDVLQG
jgi:hypothetical protein